ncbi:MAG: hypothetical protein GY742_15025 [Hyphomicrobiales bacterium]|nr:hypothetical protein [Hyphomicrobiales bacterium]
MTSFSGLLARRVLCGGLADHNQGATMSRELEKLACAVVLWGPKQSISSVANLARYSVSRCDLRLGE